MNKNIFSPSEDIILNLKVLAKEKEGVRRSLAATASKLAATASKLAATASKLAATAKEKESVRRKLATTAKEKESVRRKLAATASKLAITASKLAETAKEKESVRRKLATTAKEKESVRRKLAVTAEKLKSSYQTLEKKVLERTKDLEMARAKEGAILQSIGDGLLATDEAGRITFVNATAEKLLQKKSHNVLGKVFFEVLPLEDKHGVVIPAEHHPVRIALLKTRTAAYRTGATYYYMRHDTTKFPMAIMATPISLEGKVIGTIEVFRDITYEREIDKAKTEFVSLASHQLRTPLSTVNWYAEMLLAGDAGMLNEKQTKYLGEVYSSNQRMVELVNALLDVSRLELGTFVNEPKPTDIVELTQNVVDEQKPEIEKKRMHFTFASVKNTPLIQADPKLLRMVVQNILSNAVKYTPEGGTIEMSISLEKKGSVLFRVADTGYGIPKDQQAKIFTKLFRADNVRNKDTDGTGLGLYIVKSVVENSGGKIWFSSPDSASAGLNDATIGDPLRNPGTTFFVRLPLGGSQKKKNAGEIFYE